MYLYVCFVFYETKVPIFATQEALEQSIAFVPAIDKSAMNEVNDLIGTSIFLESTLQSTRSLFSLFAVPLSLSLSLSLSL